MPSRSASRAINLELDTEALRHLVANPEVGRILWDGEVREDLREVFLKLHGESSLSHLDHILSKELLLARIKLLPPLLEHLYEQNNDARAQRLLAIVAEILDTHLEDSKSLQFHEEFAVLLQQAVLQASLQILMKAAKEDLPVMYKSAVSLVRDISSSCEDSVSAQGLKKSGVRLIKNVAALLVKNDKKGALMEANEFLQKYSYTRTAGDLQAQASVLQKELGPIKIRQSIQKPTKRATRATRTGQAARRTRPYQEDDRPNFFSDESDETSNVTADEGKSPGDEMRDRDLMDLAEVFGSGVYAMDDESNEDRPKPPKKRARMSRREKDLNAHASRGHDDTEDRSSTPVSKSRGKRYPELAHELDGMGSPMFSETRPPAETVDHVVRHARARTGYRTRYQTQRASDERQARRRRSPTSISQEAASPTHKGGRAHASDEELDDELEQLQRKINRADEDKMNQMGTEGTVLRDLHSKATKLLASGPSDPLRESVRDARRARRKGDIEPQYSPTRNARDVSPFPGSDDDDNYGGMPRKKMSRLELVQTPEGRRSKRGAGPSAARSNMTLDGKPCRVGRFEKFEDKLLLNGLQALGWGAWTEIARQYWEGDFTRAPGSLKDRARTLGLTPHVYPRRLELRGRPRLGDYPRDDPGNRGGDRSGGDDDVDEDEEDPIECPDGTPNANDKREADDENEGDSENENENRGEN